MEEHPEQPEEVTTIQITQEITEEASHLQFPVEEQPQFPEISIKFQPPEFVQTIVDTEVDEGDILHLRATVKGTPPVTITWLHEGTELVVSISIFLWGRRNLMCSLMWLHVNIN